jgi:hypothetical protein
LAVSFQQPDASTIKIEMHHGARKNVAALRTVRSLVNNMIIGVTKGFKYKMRYVYAHFPINVNLDKDNDTGLWVVEIRYATLERRERRNNVKNGIANTDILRAATSSARSSSAASPSVRALRSRPPRTSRTSSSLAVTPSRTSPSPPPISSRSAVFATRISVSSLTVSTFPRGATSRRLKRFLFNGLLLWYERDGGLLQAFEPADKTGPDAMEYRRLLFMMECSSAEEISCVQSVCFDSRFSNAAGNLTSSKACFHRYPVYGTNQDRISGIFGIRLYTSDVVQFGECRSCNPYAMFMNPVKSLMFTSQTHNCDWNPI